MAQEYSQVNFRIPSKLKEDIEKAASANNRSITSELVSRLEESFEPEVRVSETLEFQLMMQSYLEQAKQIKELKEMLEQVLKKG
ncbi:Arc family DNA-binding protein [Acinetobacter towneri]|uniref:Arc family DNA-binding protein n=1 Tax=Acinetobacter towneri TaxID=202956 RepID=UPI003A8914A2